jgi:phage terminase Nu1 subunit (DNA packaging protein)
MSIATKKVSELTGIPVSRLQFWVREGILTPESSGEGRQRRLRWSEADIAAAKQLSNGRGKADVLHRMLIQAEAARDRNPLASVIVAGSSSTRAFDGSETIKEVVAKVGKLAVLIA